MRLLRDITYAPNKRLHPGVKIKTTQQLRALNEGSRVVVLEEGTDNIFFDGSRWLFDECMKRGHFQQ